MKSSFQGLGSKKETEVAVAIKDSPWYPCDEIVLHLHMGYNCIKLKTHTLISVYKLVKSECGCWSVSTSVSRL